MSNDESIERLLVSEKEKNDTIFPANTLSGSIEDNEFFKQVSYTRHIFTTSSIVKPWVYDGLMIQQAIYNPFINLNYPASLYIVHRYNIYHTQYTDFNKAVNAINLKDPKLTEEIKIHIRLTLEKYPVNHFTIRVVDRIPVDRIPEDKVIEIPDVKMYVSLGPETISNTVKKINGESVIVTDTLLIVDTKDKTTVIIEALNNEDVVSVDILGREIPVESVPTLDGLPRFHIQSVSNGMVSDIHTVPYLSSLFKKEENDEELLTKEMEERLNEAIQELKEATLKIADLEDFYKLRAETIKHKSTIIKFIEAMSKHELNLSALERSDISTVTEILKLLKTVF